MKLKNRNEKKVATGGMDKLYSWAEKRKGERERRKEKCCVGEPRKDEERKDGGCVCELRKRGKKKEGGSGRKERCCVWELRKERVRVVRWRRDGCWRGFDWLVTLPVFYGANIPLPNWLFWNRVKQQRKKPHSCEERNTLEIEKKLRQLFSIFERNKMINIKD